MRLASADRASSPRSPRAQPAAHVAHAPIAARHGLASLSVLPPDRAGAPDGTLRRAPAVPAAPGTSQPSTALAERRVAHGGRSLHGAERSFFEPRLGADLSHVRVHEGPDAHVAAASVGARAYTVGHHIVLGRESYGPASSAGRRLMAHELTHVLQQDGATGRTGPSARLQRQEAPESWQQRLDRWREAARVYEERGERWVEGLSERIDRGVERGQEYGERALEEAERRLAQAEQASAAGAEQAERWWGTGSGEITEITFDGSTATLHGTAGMSVPARSGLTTRHRNNTERIDYTRPEYQHVPDMGPIPEGSYYLDPREVDNHPPSAAWGGHRVRLHETWTTALYRRATTERSGGFFLHGDGGNDGTAGCIGVISLSDTAAVMAVIEANAQRIPVSVDYPEPAPEPSTEAEPIRRWPLSRPLTPMLQMQEAPQSAPPHYLLQAGIDRLHADQAGGYSDHYYDTLARHLFEVALNHTGRDYGDAFDLLNDLQDGDLGFALQREYTALVGTDSSNGWDKIRHFIYTAYLQYHSGGFLAPEVFTYGKEMWDAIEGFFGADPEGYSIPDIRADNRGETFAEQMRARELAENREHTRQELERARRVFIDQNPEDVMWFIQNFGH
jgi:hypothetical protein